MFSVDDYPPEAVAKGWEGTVRLELAIGTTGTVTACRILHSSGYPTLDTRTCEILTERARFKPAMNNLGQPMPDTYTTQIAWRLEKEPEPEAPVEPAQ